MNQQIKIEAPSKLRLWDVLAKTDPKHTKAFSRSGGFKGTAVKPIWTVKRLTEQFGPCGEGWGINEPRFEVVPGNGEMLVYCTVSCWHTTPDQVLWGVGGDKVVAKNKNGLFCDDEAFKKAFTDAVGNAFKFIGVAADIHMGQFEDSKYLEQMREEFADKINDDQFATLQQLLTASRSNVKAFCDLFHCTTVEDLPAEKFDEALAMVNAKIARDAKKAKEEV